jgi:hypothetical protein
MPAELIQAGGEILLSAIHKLINSVWNKKELQVSDIIAFTVLCKLINFVFQMFPLFIPEISAGFTSYIV